MGQGYVGAYHFLVAVVDRGHDLPKVPPGLALLHAAVRDEVVEQLAAFCELHHEDELGRRVDHLPWHTTYTRIRTRVQGA